MLGYLDRFRVCVSRDLTMSSLNNSSFWRFRVCVCRVRNSRFSKFNLDGILSFSMEKKIRTCLPNIIIFLLQLDMIWPRVISLNSAVIIKETKMNFDLTKKHFVNSFKWLLCVCTCLSLSKLFWWSSDLPLWFNRTLNRQKFRSRSITVKLNVWGVGRLDYN